MEATVCWTLWGGDCHVSTMPSTVRSWTWSATIIQTATEYLQMWECCQHQVAIGNKLSPGPSEGDNMVHSKRCQAEESPYLQSILIETVLFYTVGQVFKRAWLSVKILNYVVMFSKCFSTHQLLLQMLAAHVLTGMQLFPTCAFPLGTLVSVHKHCLLVSSLQSLPSWVSNML